jgi:DNA-binding response OmpR family regulator
MMDAASKKRILIVEDEPTIIEVCQRTLVREFDVDIAVNGSLGKDMLEKKEYDLIIVDIVTPVMDGKQLYHFIAEKHPHLAKRVVFTTGDVLGSDTKSFIEKGGQPFLLKPFTPSELVSVVRKTLCQAE